MHAWFLHALICAYLDWGVPWFVHALISFFFLCHSCFFVHFFITFIENVLYKHPTSRSNSPSVLSHSALDPWSDHSTSLHVILVGGDHPVHSGMKLHEIDAFNKKTEISFPRAPEWVSERYERTNQRRSVWPGTRFHSLSTQCAVVLPWKYSWIPL